MKIMKGLSLFRKRHYVCKRVGGDVCDRDLLTFTMFCFALSSSYDVLSNNMKKEYKQEGDVTEESFSEERHKRI